MEITIPTSSNHRRTISTETTESSKEELRFLGFFDLPGELRNRIYGVVFDTMLAPPKHIAWDDLPGHDRFQTYLSLLLTSAQISREVKSLFSLSRYVDQLIFYFDNIDTIYSFQMRARKHRSLDQAQAVLRCSVDNHHSQYRKTYRAAELMTLLPGWQYNWCPYPNLYGPITEDWSNPSPTSVPEGFVYARGQHPYCQKHSKMDDCLKFYTLSFPLLDKNIQVIAYRWIATAKYQPYYTTRDGTEHLAAATTKGRLADYPLERHVIEYGQETFND